MDFLVLVTRTGAARAKHRRRQGRAAREGRGGGPSTARPAPAQNTPSRAARSAAGPSRASNGPMPTLPSAPTDSHARGLVAAAGNQNLRRVVLNRRVDLHAIDATPARSVVSRYRRSPSLRLADAEGRHGLVDVGEQRKREVELLVEGLVRGDGVAAHAVGSVPLALYWSQSAVNAAPPRFSLRQATVAVSTPAALGEVSRRWRGVASTRGTVPRRWRGVVVECYCPTRHRRNASWSI